MESIEKVAKELFNLHYGKDGSFEGAPSGTRQRWINQAKHVLAREIEARIEELERIEWIESAENLNFGIAKRIDQLQSEKQSLELK